MQELLLIWSRKNLIFFGRPIVELSRGSSLCMRMFSVIAVPERVTPLNESDSNSFDFPFDTQPFRLSSEL